MSFASRAMPATFGGGGGTNALYSGTVTQGQLNNTFFNGSGVQGELQNGYSASIPGSSRNPTTLTDGKTLAAVYDDFFFTNNVPVSTAVVQVSGFGGDPGSAYLSKAQLAGQSALQVASSSYSYSAGTATWQWPGSVLGFSGSGDIGLTLTGA